MSKTKELKKLQELLDFGEQIIATIAKEEDKIIKEEKYQSALIASMFTFAHKQARGIEILLNTCPLYKESICVLLRVLFETSINIRYVALSKKNAMQFFYKEIDNKKSFALELLKLKKNHPDWDVETDYIKSEGGLEYQIKKANSDIAFLKNKFGCEETGIPKVKKMVEVIEKENLSLTKENSIEFEYRTLYFFLSLITHTRSTTLLQSNEENHLELNLNSEDDYHFCKLVYLYYLIVLDLVSEKFGIKDERKFEKFKKVVLGYNKEVKNKLDENI